MRPPPGTSRSPSAGRIIWSPILSGVASRGGAGWIRPGTTGAGNPDNSCLPRGNSAKLRAGEGRCASAPNIVERRRVRQEPGMARRAIVRLPLAPVGRLLVCPSWQLRPGGATRAADRSGVPPRGPSNVQDFSRRRLPCSPRSSTASPSVVGQEHGGRRRCAPRSRRQPAPGNWWCLFSCVLLGRTSGPRSASAAASMLLADDATVMLCSTAASRPGSLAGEDRELNVRRPSGRYHRAIRSPGRVTPGRNCHDGQTSSRPTDEGAAGQSRRAPVPGYLTYASTLDNVRTEAATARARTSANYHAGGKRLSGVPTLRYRPILPSRSPLQIKWGSR